MKKFMVIAAVVAFSMMSVSAFAQQGRGWGGGNGGCGNCWNGGGQGAGYNRGGGAGGFGGADLGFQNEAEARVAIEEFVSENFKGYKLGSMNSRQGRMGTMYAMEATDASSNSFLFIATPMGYVRGPILVEQMGW
jgi:hypothetical protein